MGNETQDVLRTLGGTYPDPPRQQRIGRRFFQKLKPIPFPFRSGNCQVNPCLYLNYGILLSSGWANNLQLSNLLVIQTLATLACLNVIDFALGTMSA